ncbi:hypothetical protein QFZ78_000990 [Paenibacillus sp. V4I5]|nr:hypothetical protein [Paenibacillus sp. V4I5]
MISNLFYRLKNVIYFFIVCFLGLEILDGRPYPFFILGTWFALMSLAVYLDNHVLMLILIPEFKSESNKQKIFAQIKGAIIISIFLFICGIIEILT